MKAYVVRKIGEHRGAPRLWIEGRQPLRAGFSPGVRYDVAQKGHSIVLTVSEGGKRAVTPRPDGTPIIDINSREDLAPVAGMKVVRIVFRENSIHVLPVASEVRRRERVERLREKIASGKPLSIGSFAHGGGVLSHAVHAGIADAGMASELAFANEIDFDLLSHAEKSNDAWGKDTRFLAAPMQEIVFDEWAGEKIPKVDILEGGIPCSGASKAGRSKRGLSLPEAHPEVGHLVAAAVALIARVNPAVVIIENVPEYAESASGYILRHMLRDLGYAVHERTVNGLEFNALENRTRWAMVAVTEGIPFDLSALDVPERIARTLSEALEEVPGDDPRWNRMEYLKAKEESDRAAGKGFKMQIVDGGSPCVGTIGKGYQKNRSTEPKVRHPEDENLLRLLTPAEHARVKGVPERLIEGLSSTTAHEMLGQSVVYAPFRAIGRLVAEALSRFSLAGEGAEVEQRAFGICG